MRIIVNPDQLQSLAQQLSRTSADLQGVSGSVGGALGGLDWEARQRAGVDSMAGQARSQASALANQAQSMASYLSRKAQAFAEADQQGAISIDVVFKDNPPPTTWPTPTQFNLPSIGQLFDGLKASLSTLALFVTSAGLDAVRLAMGTGDFFLRKMPRAEQAFRKWEDYNSQFEDWDRQTADKYQEEARKALEDLGVAGVKDALDTIVDKLPKTADVQKLLGKIYDSLGSIQDWADALSPHK